MEKTPVYINFIFGLTTLLATLLFYKANNHSKPVLLILTAWLTLQTFIGLSGFYTLTDSIPPRFLLLVFPPILLIIFLFVRLKGRHFIDSLDIRALTILHIIRIPVELVLFWLFVNKGVPKLMTFEGRNFDIISGLTAPAIYYFGLIKKRIHWKIILTWNGICLVLLVNIVVNAVLSAPFPFQQFAFDQPNIAVLYFPFLWLPGYIVPLVLFSHLAAIRQLIIKRNNVNIH